MINYLYLSDLCPQANQSVAVSDDVDVAAVNDDVDVAAVNENWAIRGLPRDSADAGHCLAN